MMLEINWISQLLEARERGRGRVQLRPLWILVWIPLKLPGGVVNGDLPIDGQELDACRIWYVEPIRECSANANPNIRTSISQAKLPTLSSFLLHRKEVTNCHHSIRAGPAPQSHHVFNFQQLAMGSDLSLPSNNIPSLTIHPLADATLHDLLPFQQHQVLLTGPWEEQSTTGKQSTWATHSYPGYCNPWSSESRRRPFAQTATPRNWSTTVSNVITTGQDSEDSRIQHTNRSYRNALHFER